MLVENVVEETIEEGDVQAILLSTSFSTGYGQSYDYDINDLKNIVKSPPKYIKITRTPVNGEIVVKKFGKDVVLQAGDIVDTDLMKEFLYDQGENTCTSENPGSCTDGFSYIPYGEWIGTGDYQRTNIKISPR